MNHGIKQRKFGRYTAHRKALFKNLSKSLINHEQIVTTLAKAKDLRPIIEKLVTIGKKSTLHSRRRLISFFGGNTKEVKKMFDTISKRYRDRAGGYTRIIKAGFRKGDNAPVAIIEFVDRNVEAKGSV